MKKKSKDNTHKKIHYYISDNDSIFADINGQMHIYNYVERGFVSCDNRLDIMKWHEFPASELEEIIKETEKKFWYLNNLDNKF